MRRWLPQPQHAVTTGLSLEFSTGFGFIRRQSGLPPVPRGSLPGRRKVFRGTLAGTASCLRLRREARFPKPSTEWHQNQSEGLRHPLARDGPRLGGLTSDQPNVLETDWMRWPERRQCAGFGGEP